MLFIDSGNLWLLLFFLGQASGVSYNLPKFCPNATWNPNATTLANFSVVGSGPRAIFVNTNNTLYLVAGAFKQVLIWLGSSIVPTRNISGELGDVYGVFVATNGDIYVDNGNLHKRIDKWARNATNSAPVMNVTDRCFSLFVDTNNTLYCSIDLKHMVVKASLDNIPNSTLIAAGNGTQGTGTYMLYWPNGIFVDSQFNLYVADYENNRIQRFRSGELNGTTVTINGTTTNISLNHPMDVVLDVDNYLFIADHDNKRIIGSGPDGFRCIIGCPEVRGAAPDQLSGPRYLAFDSYGNIFVSDFNGNRIQKFLLVKKSCDETTTTQQLHISTHYNAETSTTVIPSSVESTFDNATIFTTQPHQKSNQPLSSFVPPTCPNSSLMGTHCNISQTPCDLFKPCQNNGICTDLNDTLPGYLCSCLSGFDGTRCEVDNRPCKPNTCWYNGTCNETTNTTFLCLCQLGWEGINCEQKVNYCQNITCQNRAVCRPLFRNYTCECLGESFSGRHCEITATSMVVRQMVSKSFGYIAILSLITVVMFIVILDILKYCFGIDPAREELERIQRKNQIKRVKHKPVIERFVYVN